MTNHPDTNAEIWKSKESVGAWVARSNEREAQRAEQRRFMGALLPFGDEEAFTFLDLGAGTGAAARAVLDLYPHSQSVLADFSNEMMEEGARAMEPYEGRYRYVEFDMMNSEWPDEIPSQLDATITSMCIHHLPDQRKQTLFQEIFDRLRPGGWYLNYDPVISEESAVESTWTRVNDRFDPDALHKRTHRTPTEQAHYENHIRYMIPLDHQLAFLRKTGFVAVDVYWKRLENVIYGGYRPT